MKYSISILICIIAISLSFKLSSNDLKNNEIISLDFTPFGKDINPSFEWDDVPENTKSFAFTLEDPDCPSGLFYHWVLINIPRNQRTIAQHSFPGKAIKNSWGILKYKGPKPPSGTHHYHFIIYALDVESLSIRSYEDFKTAVQDHIIDKAEIVGLFSHDNDL